MPLRVTLFCLSLQLFLCLPAPSMASAFEGPLWSKNQFPLMLPAIPPYPDEAATENSWALSLSYSSVFLLGTSSEWVVNADMEMTEVTFRYRRTLETSLEVGLDIPVLAFTSGFLDGLVHSYHDAFGFPDYGRSSRPENEFLYQVSREGAPVIKGSNGSIGLGDIRLTLKQVLRHEDPVISVKAEVELPTGDGRKGFGNENVDAALVLLLDKRLGQHVQAHFNLGLGVPGHYKGYQTVRLKGFLFGGVAVEASPWDRLSLIGQVFLQQSPWRTTGIPEVDDVGVLLTLGGRYRLGPGSLEISLTEDLNTTAVPDFTLAFSFKKRL